jgi:3-oxoacyl-[acyl-carrier-protein] synthase I
VASRSEALSPAATVQALGLACSLGTDVVTACAAARAGIVRASIAQHYRVRSEVEGDEEAVAVHEASLYTRGFEGETRLVRLAQGALADLLRQAGGVEGSPAFYVALPDPGRLRRGLGLIADEAALAKLSRPAQEGAEPDGKEACDAAARRIVARAATLAGWPGVPVVKFSSGAGHAAGAEALREAALDIARGAPAAIVLGVDTLLDEATLDWLHACGRLKCHGAPAGLQPGEAAVAVMLTSPQAGQPEATTLRCTPSAQEERAFFEGASAAGEALAQVVGQARADLATGAAWILSDQNGEVYRATDWGYALVRLRPECPELANPQLWYPAMSFGDTGAASALVALCLAVRAWERGYAPCEAAIVTCCGDDGARAALALERQFAGRVHAS